jgi:hypothetical protein
LLTSIDGFCASHLNDEYRQRPSPLLGGREPSWCAGVVHAIGNANFLFDKSQTPHCKPTLIYAHFGVSPGTGHAHSKKVRDLLRIAPFSPDWTLPSQLETCAKGLIPYVPAQRDQARSNTSSLEK